MPIESMKVRLRWRIQDVIDRFKGEEVSDPRFKEWLCHEIEWFLTAEGIDIHDTTKKG